MRLGEGVRPLAVGVYDGDQVCTGRLTDRPGMSVASTTGAEDCMPRWFMTPDVLARMSRIQRPVGLAVEQVQPILVELELDRLVARGAVGAWCARHQ